MTKAWVAYAAFVIYGSLVPLDFQPLPLAQAWQSFLAIPYLELGVDSRADWVANGVLYVPLGALGALALGRGRARWELSLLSLALAVLLAVGIEFAQLFFPPRTVSQNDLMAEGMGSVVGVLAAHSLGPWLNRWRRAILHESHRLLVFLLPAYALAYLLYCFFPFDLLLSRQELSDKLAGNSWGWLVAWSDGSSAFRLLLQATAELVLTLPLGVLVARQRRSSPLAAAALGALLGLAIELGQLLIASGISQGVSIVTRALGVALGAWAWPRWQAHGPEPMRRWIDRQLPWLVLPWLALLCAASGWGRHPWGGLARVAASWAETRFQPFYYHYYTTEAIALTSLGSVVVMYAPLALLAWSRRSSAGAAAALAGLVAAVVETGKLFLLGAHPDPTNVLIASASVGLMVRLGERLRVQPVAPLAGAVPAPRAAPKVQGALMATASAPPAALPAALPAVLPGALPKVLRPGWLLLLLPVAWWMVQWPAVWGPLLAVIVVAAVLTWRRPVAALALVPLALPVIDWAPWSGRFFVDEFDLVLLTCFALVMARCPRPAAARGLGGIGVVFVVFGLSLALSTFKGIGTGWTWDANTLSSYYSPLNGLRIAKGAFEAGVFVVMARRLVEAESRDFAWFGAGMAAGLALTVAMVLWERLAFVGNPFDFSADYRVTGPFSAMHKGGAYIECYLAVAAAFVMAEVVSSRRRRLVFWGGTLLLVATAYAMLVTYSRNGYAAFAAVLLALCVFGLRQAWGRSRALGALAVMLLLLTATAVPVLGGGFAQDRLRQSRQDLAIRVAHWSAALALRDNALTTQLFGVGVGRFPEAHFWNSREPRAAGFRIEPGDGNPFLRLGAGAPIYLDQIVSAPTGQELNLAINVRSDRGEPALTVALCRKWMLTSSDCEQVEVKGIAMAGVWQTQEAKIPPLPAATSFWESLAPIKLSLLTPDKNRVVEVDNVYLAVEKGPNLIANGSFSRGLDHWFFATDLDPPWHIHSLPVSLLFDQGWLGLLSGLALVATALLAGARAAWRGSTVGAAAFAGLLAFVISGTLNTLIDAPRFLWLLCVLAWLCCWSGSSRLPAPAARQRERAAP